MVQRSLATIYLRIGIVDKKHRRFKPAQESFEKTIEILEILAVLNPKNREISLDLASSRRELGDIYMELKNLNAARRCYDLAVNEILYRSQTINFEISIRVGNATN